MGGDKGLIGVTTITLINPASEPGAGCQTEAVSGPVQRNTGRHTALPSLDKQAAAAATDRCYTGVKRPLVEMSKKWKFVA